MDPLLAPFAHLWADTNFQLTTLYIYFDKHGGLLSHRVLEKSDKQILGKKLMVFGPLYLILSKFLENKNFVKKSGPVKFSHLFIYIYVNIIFIAIIMTISRPYPLIFFKGCQPQILLGPLLNTWSHIYFPEALCQV